MSTYSRTITVLHTEDDPAFADLVSTYLERENDRLEVITAHSAEEGHDILDEKEVDCVVADYDMPGQNGIEFLSEIRGHDGDLPFILYTGKGSEEVASDAISAGVTDYLQKRGGTEQYELLANKIVNAAEKYHIQRRMELSYNALETATEGISILDEEGTFVYVNEAYADTFGYEPEEMLGQHWGLIYSDPDVGESIVAEVPETGQWRGETVQVRKDGTQIIADHTLAFSDGNLICTVRDITEEIERREERREQQELFDQFVHAVEEYAIFLLDPQGHIASWNPGAEQLKGYTADEILGEHFSKFYRKEDQERGLPEQLLEQAAEEGSITIEGWRVRKDGSQFWANVTITAIRNDDGNLLGFGKVVQNLTTEKTYEQRLEELHTATREFIRANKQEEIAQKAVDAVHNLLNLPINACWLYDEEGDVLRPVAETEESKDLVGELPIFEREGSLSWEAFESGEVKVYDDVSIVDGRYDHETPIRSEIILPLGEFGVMNIGATEVGAFDEVDVSLARILAANAETALGRIDQQEQLQEEKAFIESALDTLEETFYVFDADLQPIRWNDRLTEVSGYSDEEIAEMSPLDFFEGENRERVASAITEQFETGTAEIEAELVTKGGDRIPMEFSGSRLTDSDGDVVGFVGVGRDITEQRRQREALESRERVLREMYDIIADRERSFIDQVKGLLELGRTELDTAYGTLSNIENEDYIFEVVDTDEGDIQAGDVVPLSATNCEIAASEEQTLVLGDVARDEPEQTDRAGYTDWGISCYIGTPVYAGDEVYGTFCFYDTEPRDGQFSEWEVTLVDLMSRWVSYELERQQANERLERQNEKLERFASIVSHDLRNPLAVLEGRLELAEETGEAEQFEKCRQAIERMETLIENLLTLARAGAVISEMEAIDLSTLTERCWENVETKDATLQIDAEKSIYADKTRLQQLLENLIRNSIEHGGESVTVTVGDLPDGFYVEDDGPGIPVDKREKAFESGYTTSSGTGFGLAIVKEIAEAHGWEARITEGAEEGGRFEFTEVPRSE